MTLLHELRSIQSLTRAEHFTSLSNQSQQLGIQSLLLDFATR